MATGDGVVVSVTELCLALCDPMDCSMPGCPVLRHLPGFAQMHVHWVSDAIQPSHPLPPSSFHVNLSQHWGLFHKSALCIWWPKYWSFSFGISPSNEYLGLISFRIDWFDFLAVQGIFKSLLQHHNLKASVLWHSIFFMAQLSHPYLTTGKTIALTIQNFVGKVMSLLFNMLSRFVIAFLGFAGGSAGKESVCSAGNLGSIPGVGRSPGERNSYPLQYSGLGCKELDPTDFHFHFPSKDQSFSFMTAVTICSDFRAQENKLCHCFHFSPFYFPWSDGVGCHDVSFLKAEFKPIF